MMVENVKNISYGIPVRDSTDSLVARPQKTVSGQNEPIKKQAQAAEVSSSLLNQIQQNIHIMHDINLQFSMHEETGRTMVNVTEQETGKLIRQIPPEQILDLAAKIDEMIGILFDKKV
ncbi:MAG: hypothetical protein AVO38_09840 [delta proteobacterium ML8_D]|jgi:flagellar protein FlaG|nr:MAG: hypothetical protein AVO38_09840 [delta proteobacterium ML8_D]